MKQNISIVISKMINASCDIEVSSDNAAALHMVRNGSETAWRTRHSSVKALWLHQMSRRGIKLTYRPTSEMAAYSLTKGLGASRLPQIKEPSFALSRECHAFKLLQCTLSSCDTLWSIEIVYNAFHVYSNSCGVHG